MRLGLRIRAYLRSLLGIDKMQTEIDELRAENEKLMVLFKEHDKAIAYIAVIHSKAFKDIMTYFKMISSGAKAPAPIQKKPDDDLIN